MQKTERVPRSAENTEKAEAKTAAKEMPLLRAWTLQVQSPCCGVHAAHGDVLDGGHDLRDVLAHGGEIRAEALEALQPAGRPSRLGGRPRDVMSIAFEVLQAD